MTKAQTPLPIATAPKDGGWVFGLLLPDGPTDTYWQPWASVTWGDSGWEDNYGNPCEPSAWVPLPDPQPRPTGWRPAEGTIQVHEISGKGWTSNGKPIEVSWRWEIHIERLDGSYDEYRDSALENTRERAEERAERWAKKYGLPIVIVPLPSNVVPFRSVANSDDRDPRGAA